MSKTLTLAPIKTSITVLFVFVLLFSCQKDALYTPSIKQQLIKKEAILELFNQMPASMLLTPNWEEALQTNMNGSAVVRMPIKNVDRLKDLLPAGLDLESKIPANWKQMSIKTGSANSQTPANDGNPNYFEQHPPELFIVRDPVSNKLNAYLLNFVPNNPNEDFGKDSIWTGKLYEWNLKGETVWVQEIEKNKLKDKYGLENPVVDNKNSISASGKILSLNDKKVSSFFGWFLDIVGDVVGWIADVLGFSTTYYYTNNGYGGGYRINWGTPGGAGEGGQGGFTGPVDRGGIYGSYIPGYSQGGGSYEPFPNTPGGPNPGSAVIPASTLYLISVLQLTDPVQMDFLATNSNISDRLATYLETNGKSIVNKEFATWAIDYLQNSDLDLQAILTISSSNYPGMNEGLPSNWWLNANWLNTNFVQGNAEIGRLTKEESALVAMYPKVALVIKLNADNATSLTISKMGYNGHNDKSDAFRHAIWLSMNGRDIGTYFAKKFSDAHETETPTNLILEKQMDLFNNAVGISIGSDAYPLIDSDASLATKVLDKLNTGKLRYLTPLDAYSRVIPNLTILKPTNE